MRQVSELPKSRFNAAMAHYTSHMHGERTQVEVFSRVPDNNFREIALGSMSLITMRCGAVSIRRDAADVRPRKDRVSTFMLMVRGQSVFNHYGHQIELEEGDFTLCNNSTQYDIRLAGPSEVILFRVPTSMVSESMPSPEAQYGRKLPSSEGLATMAAAMAGDLAMKDPEQVPPEIMERAGRHLLEVLVSSFLALPEERISASAIMSGRFWNVKRFIEEHLRNPELSPSYIARSLRLSDRYLRMIFAVSNESPSAYILRRRLEECAAQLRDPRWRQYSITNIAFGWGFNSAPHFARSFRARFDCSPREYRARNLA